MLCAVMLCCYAYIITTIKKLFFTDVPLQFNPNSSITVIFDSNKWLACSLCNLLEKE